MSRRAFLYIEETPLSFANNSLHSPLHSERGWGRGCSWGVVRLLVELYLGVSFCGFPCSVRNSVSPLGFVPSVYSVLKMPSAKNLLMFFNNRTNHNFEYWTLNFELKKSLS